MGAYSQWRIVFFKRLRVVCWWGSGAMGRIIPGNPPPHFLCLGNKTSCWFFTLVSISLKKTRFSFEALGRSCIGPDWSFPRIQLILILEISTRLKMREKILLNPRTFFLYCSKRRCSQIEPQLKVEIEYRLVKAQLY